MRSVNERAGAKGRGFLWGRGFPAGYTRLLPHKIYKRTQQRNETKMVQPKEIVSMGLFWSEWSRCLTAKHQRDQLYRVGKFDDCSKQWNDIMIAFKAKVAREEEVAKNLMKTTYYHQWTTISPTADVIWKVKETPGWNTTE
jgi:hypothetical protein